MNSNLSRAVKTDPQSFNPYHKWLGIRDTQVPPNHYRLLGLELWESDGDVIREAYSRQTNHVRQFMPGPHREHCDRILNELQSARDTLLDNQLRRPYDRWLQITLNEASIEGTPEGASRPPFVVHTAPSNPTVVPSAADIECAACGMENASSRKFCSGCGAPLWEPCIECESPCSTSDVHCGTCGTNLPAALERRTTEFQSHLAQAAEFQEKRLYSEGIRILEKALLRDHPRLATHRRRAQQMILQMREENARVEQLAATSVTDASRLLEHGEFERAALLFDEIPEHLRTPEMTQLLETIRERQVESLTLKSEIQRALSEKNLEGLLNKVDRWLELQPNNADSRKLQTRLREIETKKQETKRAKLYELATAEIQRHDYANAAKLLGQIPEEYRTPDIVKLYEKVGRRAAESKWLRADLHDAAIYDEHLLLIAQRLLKLHPEDGDAKKFIELVQRQANLPARDRLNANIVWPRMPAKSQWGFPIDIVRGFQRLAVEPAQTAVADDPAVYSVAVGLALQGLDKAALKMNLAPPEKRSMLGILKSKKRSHATAWGIDIGRFAIKAIQLAAQSDTGQVTIVNSRFIPVHADPGLDAAECNGFIQQAMKSLLDQAKLDGGAVAVSFPARRVLTRLFGIPLVDREKIGDVMQYEVKQQIPLPLETVAWDYQVLESELEEPQPGVVAEYPIALIGAKADDILAHLQTLSDRGIKVDVVQSDAVALHNFLAYEYLPAESNKKIQPGDGTKVMAMLDIGCESSNLVASDGCTLFMRSIPHGGKEFTRALTKECNLNWQQAEKLKHSPTAASQLHQIYAALQPALEKLAAEVHQSIDSYVVQDNRRTVKYLLLTGGGVKLHGLVKYLCVGH